MLLVASVVFLALIVPAALLGVFFVVSMRFENVRDSGTAFECGFDPKSSARCPFSLRFFLLAVIFLIFDVEVALLFPMIYVTFWGLKGSAGLITVIFLFVLFVGLFHEWREGSLNWV